MVSPKRGRGPPVGLEAAQDPAERALGHLGAHHRGVSDERAHGPPRPPPTAPPPKPPPGRIIGSLLPLRVGHPPGPGHGSSGSAYTMSRSQVAEAARPSPSGSASPGAALEEKSGQEHGCRDDPQAPDRRVPGARAHRGVAEEVPDGVDQAVTGCAEAKPCSPPPPRVHPQPVRRPTPGRQHPARTARQDAAGSTWLPRTPGGPWPRSPRPGGRPRGPPAPLPRACAVPRKTPSSRGRAGASASPRRGAPAPAARAGCAGDSERPPRRRASDRGPPRPIAGRPATRAADHAQHRSSRPSPGCPPASGRRSRARNQGESRPAAGRRTRRPAGAPRAGRRGGQRPRRAPVPASHREGRLRRRSRPGARPPPPGGARRLQAAG